MYSKIRSGSIERKAWSSPGRKRTSGTVEKRERFQRLAVAADASCLLTPGGPSSLPNGSDLVDVKNEEYGVFTVNISLSQLDVLWGDAQSDDLRHFLEAERSAIDLYAPGANRAQPGSLVDILARSHTVRHCI